MRACVSGVATLLPAGVTPRMSAFLAGQHCLQLATTTLAAAVLHTTRAAIATVVRQQGDHLEPIGRTGWCLRLLALGPQYRHAPTVAADLVHTIRAATGLRPIIALAPIWSAH